MRAVYQYFSRHFAPSALLLLSLQLLPLQVHSSDISVITSNRPLALLTQGILGEHGQARSLLQAGQSPHDFSLSFSDRLQLEQTQLVIWIGADIEPYLQRMLQSSAVNQLRLDQLFQLGGHNAEHGHHQHHDHKTAGNFHVWLSPQHAKTISQAIATQLARQFPELAETFAARQQQQAQEITAADQTISGLLSGIASSPYGIAHNAYSHFTEHYQLHQPLLISQSTEQPPGIRRLLQLRQQLPPQSCLLVEPEHTSGWPQQLAQRENYRLIQVDTLATRTDYPSYSQWLLQLGRDFKQCLDSGD